jgi:hypothetical protein
MGAETKYTVQMFIKITVLPMLGNTITKSNKDSVLDPIGVMPNIAEKE